MRKQYYFRPSDHGLLAWDVDGLIRMSRHLPIKQVALADIKELDEPWSSNGDSSTWRTMIEHIKLIEEADLSFPIILASDGRVMDGRHRIAKAALQGRSTIDAVQFAEDPVPAHVGRTPADLPY